MVAILDSSGTAVVKYVYDAWGRVITYTGNMAPTLGRDNPLRYRGYVYDRETGLYYLQSRYYNPTIGRFISADNQLSTGDFSGLNLFAYCGNNPVNRVDPTGEAWWHWAIAAAVVAIAAGATVITCGMSVAAAATAVGLVAQGVAASTTAATVAAGAFIGASTALAGAAIVAAGASNSLQDFYDQGSWGTVTSVAGGALLGGLAGRAISSPHQTNVSNAYSSRGSTGRTAPQNLKEKLAMEQVQSSPLHGAKQLPTTMTDPRWPSTEGWVKMASNVNGVEIHFVYNTIIHVFDDFKFKG